LYLEWSEPSSCYYHSFFTFVLGYAIRNVQKNQEGLWLYYGTHQQPVAYAADVNLWGRNLNAVKINAETLW